MHLYKQEIFVLIFLKIIVQIKNFLGDEYEQLRDDESDTENEAAHEISVDFDEPASPCSTRSDIPLISPTPIRDQTELTTGD